MIKREAYLLGGPTASGKSAAANVLARRMNAAVLSADSMLVYKGMNIGTAKPSDAECREFQIGGIDIVTPAEEFSTGAWIEAASKFIAGLPEDKPLIVAGGTGLYFTALLAGLDRPKLDARAVAEADKLIAEKGTAGAFMELKRRDPVAAVRLADPENPRRLSAALARAAAGISVLPKENRVFPSYPVLDVPRELLRRRIDMRLAQMFYEGWIDEVRSLKAEYPEWSKTAAGAIGYCEIAAALDSCTSDEEIFGTLRNAIFVRTCRLAKRQCTWFRNQAAPLPVPVAGTVEETAENVFRVWREHGPWQIFLV